MGPLAGVIGPTRLAAMVAGASVIALVLVAGAAGPPTPPDPAVMIERMDHDGDGRISRQEFRGPPPLFQRLDANGDGFVTREEIAAARARKGPQAPAGAPGGGQATWYQRLPVILTHTHFNVVSGDAGSARTARGPERDPRMDWEGARANALGLMEAHGIRAALVMPAPATAGRSPGDVLFQGAIGVARQHADRFRVLGGGATLNPVVVATRPDQVDAATRRSFTARAEEILAAGAVGFGEFTALHFSLFSGHPFEETPPDHPLLLLLADIAARHGVPIDLHMEAVTRDWDVSDRLRSMGAENPAHVSENLAALERLLRHNRQARIIWVHVGVDNTGDRSAELTGRMLRAHPNLYVSISSFQTAGLHWFVNPTLGLNPAWRAVILEFPDRFMIGSDIFFQPGQVWHTFPQHLGLATLVVRRPFLPPAVARKLAFENAQRVFGLDLIRTEDVPLPPEAEGRPRP